MFLGLTNFFKLFDFHKNYVWKVYTLEAHIYI